MALILNYEILLAFSMATAVLAISPGPDNIFVLIQSITNGRKFGLAVVAGLMTGCLVHTTLLAFGVSAIIKNNPIIFTIIKIFGAVYLFRQGFIMNVLNPKVTIFFLAFFPAFLFSNSISTIIQFYVLGLLFIVISSLVFSSVALLSGSISTFLRGNKKTGFVLKWVQVIVFIGIAIFLLFG